MTDKIQHDTTKGSNVTNLVAPHYESYYDCKYYGQVIGSNPKPKQIFPLADDP